MDEIELKKWPNSQLQTAINCLTYGINCLYFDRIENTLRPCLLSIHEQYINIVHVIIENKISFLFELQHVQGIANKDIFVRQTLKSLGFEHFIIVYTSTLESHVLVMHSENQLNVLWEGLQYFVYQGKNFYSRISEMDPFKAETTMLFMDADVDGSKLLNFSEVLQIFNKLKIYKTKTEIQQAILQINKDLYEKQNLKKPKDFSQNKLTPLGFEYILQYYSMKASLAPLFTQLCPIFKFKHKQFKKSIIDILKSQTKPLMSAIQFEQFLTKYMKTTTNQQQCLELIKTFPIYDGEGKQIPEEIEYLSFHSFCNFVFSPKNSIFDPEKSVIYQNMNQPITQYYVYSSSIPEYNEKIHNDSLLKYYEISLKKGCRCIQLDIYVEKEEIVVKQGKNKYSVLLVDALKTIKNIAFSFNSFPIIFSVQCSFPSSAGQKVAKIFNSQIGQLLYVNMQKQQRQNEPLPSPAELKNKILIQIVGNNKRSKEQQNMFTKMATLMPTKLDFERKGLTNWETCQIGAKQIYKYEEIEDKNLADYCRKAIVRTSPFQTGMLHNGQSVPNYNPFPMFRSGVQLMAHNILKEDIHHYLIHSKFIQNGGRSCGYLIKPVWMKSNCKEGLYVSNFNRVLYTLKIKVYAAQKYVLAQTNSQTFTLEIYIKGLKIEQQKNKKYTSVPKNQGFYTDFQLECEFSIFCPDLAIVVFCIVEEKNSQKILSYRAIPFNAIREGLRTVELLGPGMQMNNNSCLLVQVFKNEEKVKKKIASLLT